MNMTTTKPLSLLALPIEHKVFSAHSAEKDFEGWTWNRETLRWIGPKKCRTELPPGAVIIDPDLEFYPEYPAFPLALNTRTKKWVRIAPPTGPVEHIPDVDPDKDAKASPGSFLKWHRDVLNSMGYRELSNRKRVDRYEASIQERLKDYIRGKQAWESFRDMVYDWFLFGMDLLERSAKRPQAAAQKQKEDEGLDLEALDISDEMKARVRSALEVFPGSLIVQAHGRG